MKLRAEIKAEAYELDVRRDGGRLCARVNDREYDLEVSEPEPGVYLFKQNGRIFEAYASDLQVSIGGRTFDINIVDPKRLRGSESGSGHDHGHAEIRTAMPGKVVRILKSQGDAVTKGEGVIVVEAMKMQNEIKSPRDGTIGEIRVVEDDTVGAGDVLVVIA
jgi:biotin carboxyl carrier protein